MNKQPFFWFNLDHWYREPGLQIAPIEVKGAWITLLATMWDCEEPGKMTGSTEDFSALWNISEEETLDILHFLIDRGIADCDFFEEEDEELFFSYDDFCEITIISKHLVIQNKKL